MHHQQLDLFDAELVHHTLRINRSGITSDDLSPYRSAYLFLVDDLCRPRRNCLIELDANAVSTQPSAFDQRSSASNKCIKHPIALLGITKHELMRYLRNE